MTADGAGRDFTDWNEQMVRRYDIERYYRDSHPVVRWIERRRLDLLQRCARAAPRDRVLEIGCGAGHVLARFDGRDRTGVDLSPAMLDRARARLGAGVRLLRGSAEALPLRTASFDVVLCTEVLEHVPHPDRAIAELMRVAAPGARVVVSIPNEHNIDRAKRIVRSVPGLRRLLKTLADEGNEWHLHRFDAAYLARMTAGTAAVAEMHGVPAALLPLRYVAVLRPPANH
ncbi:MAG: class I SAM-dependent methyltransferase [Gemmatimonadota bacterium]